MWWWDSVSPWPRGRAKGNVRLAEEHEKVVPAGRADGKAVPADRDRVDKDKDKAVDARGGQAVDKAGPGDSVVQKPCDSFRSPEPSTPIRTERFPPMRSPMRRQSSSHSTKTVTAS